MSYQSELYQQVILDHNKKPRNFRPLENPTHSCDGHNPLCGDEITIYLKLNKDMMVEEISFSGSGCAISKASASLMTTHVKGKSVEEVKIMFDEFHRMIRGEFDPDKNKHHLGRLTIFIGVREFPSRTKCASLAWHTLICAIDKKGEAYTE
jgi:nitrogen fixation NifU-like protein